MQETATTISARVDRVDWPAVIDELEAALFRSTIDMARHRFGSGQYRYFRRPLPAPVAQLREALYPRLLPVARDWAERLGQPAPYTGGEFLLVEQRPRAQSRGTSTVLRRGHALVFTTRDRPVRSSRGWSASPVRHGVSTVRSGIRHSLGLVLHDAT